MRHRLHLPVRTRRRLLLRRPERRLPLPLRFLQPVFLGRLRLLRLPSTGLLRLLRRWVRSLRRLPVLRLSVPLPVLERPVLRRPPLRLRRPRRPPPRRRISPRRAAARRPEPQRLGRSPRALAEPGRPRGPQRQSAAADHAAAADAEPAPGD